MSVNGIIVPLNKSGLTQSEADDRYLKLTGGDIYDETAGSSKLVVGPKVLRFDATGTSFNENGTLDLSTVGQNNGVVKGLANPTQDNYAANKSYVDTKATKYSYTHTIPVSAWTSQTDGSYKCTRTISGITATDTPYINLEYQTTTVADQTNEKTEYSKIGRAVTAANSITFTCFNSAPTIALTLNIQGTRGGNSTNTESNIITIASGGTGATTATEARTNLGAAPAYSYGTTDLVAGTSTLAAGTLYFVYE